MRRNIIGEILFWGVGGFAFALYSLTMPDGLPWNASAGLAVAAEAFGEGGVAGEALPHPIWRYFVSMTSGNFVLLASLAAAISAGLIGSLVNRYLGWRLGLASALIWIFLPGVWNRAITGERGICLVAAIVVAVWVLNAVMLRVTRKARATQVAGGAPNGRVLPGTEQATKRARGGRIAAWSILGASVLFAIVSSTMHDYRYGEVASAFARLIVDEAGDRIILLSGICDDQIVKEKENRASKDGAEAQGLSTISLRNDDIHRAQLVEGVKAAFPSETNLWIAAQVGPNVFADVAVKAHPERFFLMTGQSTTIEKWEARWNGMSAYLDSKDPFVPMMRRSFAFEGNALANDIQAKGDLKAAWKLYWRIFTEIEPKNLAACVNLSEMMRRGYKTDVGTQQRIESTLNSIEKVIKNKNDARRVASRISTFGQVMRDQKAYEELCERVRKRMAELEKKDGKAALNELLKPLWERKNEMMKAFVEHDLDKAARIARAILSRREWRSFIPANMVLGEQMIMQGDYTAAEMFLRVAIEGKGEAAPPAFVLNDYAEVLRMLKRYDEAETYSRKAIEKANGKDWVCKLTLAQVLRDAGKNQDEVKKLVNEVLKQAPQTERAKIRKEFR